MTDEPLLPLPTPLPADIEMGLARLHGTAMVAGSASQMAASNPGHDFWGEQEEKRKADAEAALYGLRAAIIAAIQEAKQR